MKTVIIPECDSEVIIERWLCSWWPFSATPYRVAAKSFSLARELEEATLHDVDDFRFSDIERCTEEDMWCEVACCVSTWLPSPISEIFFKGKRQAVSGQIYSYRPRSGLAHVESLANRSKQIGQIGHSIAWQTAVPGWKHLSTLLGCD